MDKTLECGARDAWFESNSRLFVSMVNMRCVIVIRIKYFQYSCKSKFEVKFSLDENEWSKHRECV